MFSEEQRRGVLPLKKSLWPSREGISLWPDVKTPKELCLSLLLGYKERSRHTHENRVQVALKQANKDIGLLESILVENLIGIRMGMELPSKYFGYFRRRWGFLILTSSRLPTGLIRYLISKWITDPYSLWLQERKGFKQYLKSLPISVVNRVRSRADATEDYFSGDTSEDPDSEGLYSADELYSEASDMSGSFDDSIIDSFVD